MAVIGDAVRGPGRSGSASVLVAETSLRPSTSAQLDAADLRIIDALVADGRANARSITSAAGLSEETVAGRIRGLIDRNIIGISAILDWRAAGYQWDLFLSMRWGSDGPGAAIEALVVRDEVVSIYEVFGQVDLVAHVLCRDRATMLELVSTTLPRIDGIGPVDVMLSLDTVKYFHQFSSVAVGGFELPLPNPVVDLTPVDHGIISALTRDGRASHREIARQLGVADGTIRTRHRRLVSSGLLQVRAQIHPANSGMVGASAFVGITTHGADRADVAMRLAEIGEIITIAITASRFDVFCYVVARHRMDLIELIATRIRLVDGVRALETWEVTSVPKHVGGWARW